MRLPSSEQLRQPQLQDFLTEHQQPLSKYYDPLPKLDEAFGGIDKYIAERVKLYHKHGIDFLTGDLRDLTLITPQFVPKELVNTNVYNDFMQTEPTAVFQLITREYNRKIIFPARFGDQPTTSEQWNRMVAEAIGADLKIAPTIHQLGKLKVISPRRFSLIDQKKRDFSLFLTEFQKTLELGLPNQFEAALATKIVYPERFDELPFPTGWWEYLYQEFELGREKCEVGPRFFPDIAFDLVYFTHALEIHEDSIQLGKYIDRRPLHRQELVPEVLYQPLRD